MSTENLSTEQRRNLADGAVIEWLRPCGGWQRGTVDYPTHNGWVWLYDGSGIGPKTVIRLVSASPAIPTDCDVRGVNNDGVRFATRPAAAPAKLPSDLALDEAADADEALPLPAEPKPPKRSRRGDNKRQDAALWLRAVEAVQEAMYNGMDRASAVRGIAELPEFAGIKLNIATFCWWRSKLVREGKLPKPRKTMPKLASRPKDDTAELRKEVAEQAEALRQGRVTIDRLRADLATHAEALRGKESDIENMKAAGRVLQNNLNSEFDRAQKALRELANEREALKAAEADRASLALATQELQQSLAACHERITEQRDQLASERAARALLHRELGAAKVRAEPPPARVSVTIEATPAEAAAILAAIGGR